LGEEELEHGSVLPPLDRIRDVSVAVAAAVIRTAAEEGLATVVAPDDIEAYVRDQMYVPEYRSYV
jgi:malate dehydrogenase (oxaloacetate-decarboxylating)(NADP+)